MVNYRKTKASLVGLTVLSLSLLAGTSYAQSREVSSRTTATSSGTKSGTNGISTTNGAIIIHDRVENGTSVANETDDCGSKDRILKEGEKITIRTNDAIIQIMNREDSGTKDKENKESGDVSTTRFGSTIVKVIRGDKIINDSDVGLKEGPISRDEPLTR